MSHICCSLLGWFVVYKSGITRDGRLVVVVRLVVGFVIGVVIGLIVRLL